MYPGSNLCRNNKFSRFLIEKHKHLCRKLASTVPSANEEYVSTPQYPPILDLSPEKVRERKKAAVYEQIQNVKTVEEKQIKLNMPKYYGFKCYLFKEDTIPFNSLALTQHITRTHVKEVERLPNFYGKLDTASVFEDVKAQIEEVLLVEYETVKRDLRTGESTKKEHENSVSTHVSRQINRVITNSLAKTFPHLKTAQVDYDPRIESFWFAGGMNPPLNIVRYRENYPYKADNVNEPTNRAIQYFGSPTITIRSELPLRPIIPLSEADNVDFVVPYFKYDPRTIGTTTEHRRAVNTPGFWPGDAATFGLISYHKRGHLLERCFNDSAEAKEAVYRQAVLASFGWLSAQANFQGFTTFNDVTYPLVTQGVITNGQIWSFCVYQLNTLLVHSKCVTENPKKNVCWISPELQLFEEIKDGKIIGLNDDVIKNLINFYSNAPEARLGVNMQPYLSNQEKLIADYADEDKRQWLEREYKFLVSNRNRYKLDYEVYSWEKIYKIDHDTRPMDKKRRPFELKFKPSDRTLDDRRPIYVPRALRPDLPRHKGRYKKEYFP